LISLFLSPGIAQFISDLIFGPLLVPVIANSTAKPLITGEAIKTELINQLCYSVQWQDSVEYMIEKDVTTFIEIGLGVR
jgi:[acyl-carrier-protein] S-malonyltransferase